MKASRRTRITAGDGVEEEEEEEEEGEEEEKKLPWMETSHIKGISHKRS